MIFFREQPHLVAQWKQALEQALGVGMTTHQSEAQAQSINRAVARDDGCGAQIADQGVVIDARQHHQSRLPAIVEARRPTVRYPRSIDDVRPMSLIKS
jgi:hypothetical protein